MKFKDFLYYKIIYIFFWIVFIFLFSFTLYILKINRFTIIFFDTMIIFFNIFMFLYEYFIKSRFYNTLYSNLYDLDKKYLLSEVISKPSFYEGKILFDVLKQTDKGFNDDIAKYRLSIKEYKEYVETWIHEIKTPIASSKLIIENNKNDITLSIDEELEKIDNLVEQALFYAKSSNVEKDYMISENNLKNLISEYLKNNYKLFASYKVKVEIKDLDFNVCTDKKWIMFIISQIISNSIKYKASKIKIYSVEKKNNVNLYIEDNGIGIEDQDISRVFEKGFTGLNGRKYAKSTGIGLYLCKKLCDKLCVGISIESILDKYTIIVLSFPKSDMYKF